MTVTILVVVDCNVLAAAFFAMRMARVALLLKDDLLVAVRMARAALLFKDYFLTATRSTTTTILGFVDVDVFLFVAVSAVARQIGGDGCVAVFPSDARSPRRKLLLTFDLDFGG